MVNKNRSLPPNTLNAIEELAKTLSSSTDITLNLAYKIYLERLQLYADGDPTSDIEEALGAISNVAINQAGILSESNPEAYRNLVEFLLDPKSEKSFADRIWDANNKK